MSGFSHGELIARFRGNMNTYQAYCNGEIDEYGWPTWRGRETGHRGAPVPGSEAYCSACCRDLGVSCFSNNQLSRVPKRCSTCIHFEHRVGDSLEHCAECDDDVPPYEFARGCPVCNACRRSDRHRKQCFACGVQHSLHFFSRNQLSQGHARCLECVATNNRSDFAAEQAAAADRRRREEEEAAAAARRRQEDERRRLEEAAAERRRQEAAAAEARLRAVEAEKVRATRAKLEQRIAIKLEEIDELRARIASLSNGTAKPSSGSTMTCVVCLDAPRSTMHEACGHCSTCSECATSTCPICRTVSRPRKIFFS